jgi:hypothetical protein
MVDTPVPKGLNVSAIPCRDFSLSEVRPNRVGGGMTTERPVCSKCEKPRMTREEWDQLDDWASSVAMAAFPERVVPEAEAYRTHCLCSDGGAFGPP